MSLSPARRLHADFAALFGGELHSGRLIQAAAANTDNARWPVFGDADRVACDEQQDHNDS